MSTSLPTFEDIRIEWCNETHDDAGRRLSLHSSGKALAAWWCSTITQKLNDADKKMQCKTEIDKTVERLGLEMVFKYRAFEFYLACDTEGPLAG